MQGFRVLLLCIIYLFQIVYLFFHWTDSNSIWHDYQHNYCAYCMNMKHTLNTHSVIIIEHDSFPFVNIFICLYIISSMWGFPKWKTLKLLYVIKFIDARS